MEYTTEKDHQARREQINREELAARLALSLPEDGTIEPVKGVRFFRSSKANAIVYGVSQASLCVIAQGGKEILVGGQRYHYDPYNYLLFTTNVPVMSCVVTTPYLALSLFLDPVVVGSVIVEMGQIPPRGQNPAKAVQASPLGADLLDAVLRLVKVAQSPPDGKLLLPLITREIIYRLLQGGQGDRLRQMSAIGGHTHRISLAVTKLCREFDQPLHVETLAREIGMSVSGFHHHFKEVTGMSPLQFHKQLRLQEAQRLMIGEALDATTAGFRVGYDDTAHFNRDYKRFFGEPPMRDVERLRLTATV